MNCHIETVKGARLSDGESLAIPSPNAKNHNRIDFSAGLVSFDAASRLIVSHGRTGPWCSAYVAIDAEAVSVYEYPGMESPVERIPHGLTLNEFIGVSLAVGAGFSAELTLATVPNTPIRNHTYKNGIVRESGCRYLDINAAVGADADAAWREGLLSPDRVHPTAEGARVIAEYILSALFESGSF